MENEKLVLALVNNKFSDEFFESIKLAYPEAELSRDKKYITFSLLGSKMDISINRTTGELEYGFPSMSVNYNMSRFNCNIIVFETFQKFWYHARMMKKVEQIYSSKIEVK